MASPTARQNAQPREQDPLEQNHPEPACQEAQKWIEAVTGKSFGDKDFRSALENGILLCELLSAIKPGLVKKINRLPTPIAGLDNLSLFLRGCEELGLKGAQLFDPGDLQDTSIRANLKDSDCNRKLKNVLNTMYWLGKAASGCASYSGPTLNLKEFEGLLAQMKVESEEGGDSPQKRSVRDSGYDCWDSERSESLSPPRHTRDNSLDSLDSFGSRSQHSPSPDVVNRGNSDGRGSDSEADASSRKPDVRKDDMLARRTASGESRCSIPFNQFLPNRTNVTSYIPTARRKPLTEEKEQRRSVSMGDILNEEDIGHLPPLSQSRYERVHEQYINFQEEEDHWQNDLARWKTRRRSASQELIKKEEERKRIEKRMKEEGGDGNKRKSIKTYKEIVEEKERREAELCEAYRNAATPEEAALVLQRYALRFTISDATLESLKLPRSASKPKQDLIQVDKEHRSVSPLNNSEMSDWLHKPKSSVIAEQYNKPEDREADATDHQEESADTSTSSLTPNSPNSPFSPATDLENVPPQSLQLNEPQVPPTKSVEIRNTPTELMLMTSDGQPQTKQTSPQSAQVQAHPPQPPHALPSPPSVSSKPVPLLAAKPYCQPRSSMSGLKPVKMDGLVRVNGEVTEDIPASSLPASPQHPPQEIKDVSSNETKKEIPPVEPVKNTETARQPPPPQTEKSTFSSGSAISSLIGGRNCIITTTIVTELTQTVVEPLHQNGQNNKQIGTTGSLGRPSEEKIVHEATSPSTTEDHSPTVTEGLEESSVTEQYQREQEKLMKEWEKAQLEVEEEERKHNEEERRILEETVTPLNSTGLLIQQSGQMATTPSAVENNTTSEGKSLPIQHNGQNVSTGKEDQHSSKLHFFQDSPCDAEPSKKQELWKTASLDRNPQLNQAQNVKRSGSHDTVTSKKQSSSAAPQPPSPSRCVSGKRLCSGCSQPLGKGAAMIIDTLGLFFHIQCFKCGVCKGQLGDATAGTDVRIRNGLLSCHECYIASRGRGQPTPL
ncbi:LIM and calponin homology domains-containing protein 1-like isoform 2-T2 [Pholidichthys leucotaenia]